MTRPLPLLLLAIVACGTTPQDTPDATPQPDASPFDMTADVPQDTPPDVTPDATPDATPDTTSDATPTDMEADATAGPYELIVEDGYGSGTYMPGDQVHVFAGNDPWSSVVTGWEGADSGEWHFVFTMPARAVTLRPQLEPAPMEIDTTEVQDGQGGMTRILWAAPANPRGLIYFFHGTGGSADVLARYGMNGVARAAWARGYVVVAPDAYERTIGDPGPDGKLRWDATPNLATNRDLQNLDSITALILRRTNQAPDAPVHAVGMSNGGSFAITAGHVLGFRAVTSYCSTGREAAWSVTTTPTQWLMCERDSNEQVAAKRDAWRDGTQALATRSVRTDYDAHPPAPMFPGRFARLQGVDEALSRAAVEELGALGALDPQGFLALSPAEIAADVQAAPEAWPAVRAVVMASSANEVFAVLRHAWADHMMYDDWATRTLDFLEAP